ncbi:hypothetical protein ABBQ38_002300 [Trebouxia sp. C0009 RCD-2024]
MQGPFRTDKRKSGQYRGGHNNKKGTAGRRHQSAVVPTSPLKTSCALTLALTSEYHACSHYKVLLCPSMLHALSVQGGWSSAHSFGEHICMTPNITLSIHECREHKGTGQAPI